MHVALPGHQVALLIRRANAVLELDVDGTQQLTLVKDVQKDPVHQIIEHIDLLVVKKGEKIQVDVPVSLLGESAPGTIAAQDANTVLLEVEATHIPERIEVDVEGLEEGTHITAADLTLPKGASLVVDPETLIVAISVPSATLAAEDEIAEADAAVAAEQAEESEEAEERRGRVRVSTSAAGGADAASPPFLRPSAPRLRAIRQDATTWQTRG